jgi:predicted enzyme related to lactoylglutathione lyase
LVNTDVAAAQRFYGEVIGWHATDAGVPGMAYTILHAGETPIGGLMASANNLCNQGVPPHWTAYVAVDHVDTKAVEVTNAGGKIHHGPADIPGVGRFAVFADPQGAVLVLFKPQMQNAPSPTQTPHASGHAGWRELCTTH